MRLPGSRISPNQCGCERAFAAGHLWLANCIARVVAAAADEPRTAVAPRLAGRVEVGEFLVLLASGAPAKRQVVRSSAGGPQGMEIGPLPGNTPAQRKPSAAPMHGSAARGRSSSHSSVSRLQLISSAGSQQPQQEQQRTVAAVAGPSVATCLRRREAAAFQQRAGAQTSQPAHATCSPRARPVPHLLREPFACLAPARSPCPVAHQPTI